MSDTIQEIETWGDLALQLASSVSPLIAAGTAGIQVIEQTAATITAGQASGQDPTAAEIAAQDQAITSLLASLDAADDAAQKGA